MHLSTVLTTFRGTRALNDGDVIVCEAGLLPFKYVVHSVISKPVYTASQRNLTRLDNINTQVLAMANQLKVKVLAMPLIGTGNALIEHFRLL
ncbi:hypothetical protein DPMN_166778 [Dreissena polymorpha]|uniref:Macro domain-containing protein n=1 Tax=Dreissena polymorpha TaxID=45954 RepID=A0A9D4IUG8_DREPO|nr:hypothetical protein DPMN_166778 [Dreissena polymorpha]